MAEEFISDGEYPRFFENLGGLRRRIVADLPLEPGMHILDLATGYGYFAMAVAKQVGRIKIVGIDLSRSDVCKAQRNSLTRGLTDRIKIVQMDATNMGFRDGYFDAVVNFLGLEDIHMTRDRAGVRQTFTEVSEVLKPGGGFCFVAMPPEEMQGQAQKLETAVFSYTCGATWLSLGEYQKMLDAAGFELTRKESYVTGKKLTPKQAGEYIGFACQNVPKIYGIRTPKFEIVWKKFGQQIQASGLGYYSKVVLLCARKVV
jgi:ubiquinone/menaquinone biosynthesis C-methylase UbiE